MSSEYSGSLAQKILFDPITLGADKLCILSKEASPSMISWLLTTYDEKKIKGITVELIVTSLSDKGGVTKMTHEAFKEIHRLSHATNASNAFSCSYYYGTSIFTDNVLVWLFNEKPLKAYSFSCNFTQSDLLRHDGGLLSDYNEDSALIIFEQAIDKSIYCVNSEIEDFVVIGPAYVPTTEALNLKNPNFITLSLVTKRTGEPGTKSGLNWGQRSKRNRNEAYIPIPRKIAKSGFFPLNEQHFLVVTDDHHTLQLRVEQQNDKAITTPTSNAQLGEYFRNRLGLRNGVYVRVEDLDAYGRRDVSFLKIDDEQFYMDFSVDNKGEK